MTSITQEDYEQEKINKNVTAICKSAEINKKNDEKNWEGLKATPLISILEKEIVACFALNRYVL